MSRYLKGPAMKFRAIAATLTALSALPVSAVTALATPAQPQPLDWGACPVGALADSAAVCAAFEVPKDYAQPEGEKITLTMSKLPATGESRGVIAGNPGGPGGSALGMFRGADNLPGTVKLPDSVRENYDLVAVQPRGLPWGGPLDCGLAPIFEACEANKPGYTRTINTENTARDLEEARKVLGQDRLNLYGVSYGTLLMSTYATLFPQHTGKMLLDSSMNPDDIWFQLGASRKQARIDALNAMFAWIAERDAEYGLGDTPLKVYRAWTQRVNEHLGLSAAPITPPPATEGDIPAGSSVGELALTGANLVEEAKWRIGRLMILPDIVRSFIEQPNGDSTWFTMVYEEALYSEKAWPRVAESLKTGTIVPDPLVENLFNRIDGFSEEQMGTFVQEQAEVVRGLGNVDKSVLCNENRTPADPSRVTPMMVESVMGDQRKMAEDMLASGQHCAGWPEPAPLLWAKGEALDTKPLLVGYDHDTATTGAGNYAMQREMGGELHVLPGYSHGVLLNDPEAVEPQVAAYFS
ncbi:MULTISPECIES: alpha/beta fold hydrolase [unclassified Corynebacterium]|uniref:alpha/beta fold hydrolase n=1 Tax=unclassified Corynebacterium TaxID=2624378 RepID=UPI0029CA6B39|nr:MULTISPECIES: alpha/beta fold hydrolase [unclassified Corynebacterium]WPF65926.1 alpha/beta fold hydrolase [Corynebacterium sp. 22KM0430]WPF68419.1 alpha/beta fold hydrolase [Corynebacterium sp. 21KM1197]